MTAERLGDRAILVRGVQGATPALADVQAKWPAATDVVRAFETLAVYFSSPAPAPMHVLESLAHLEGSPDRKAALHRIPACYGIGPDLDAVAAACGLTPSQIVEAHSSGRYTVEAIGFSPGFPYLSGLPDALTGLPRLASPRPRVEPGSIGIVEDLSCIYPDPTPGGWNLIGRTPDRIVDVAKGFFLLSVGDQVVFEPIDTDEFARRSA